MNKATKTVLLSIAADSDVNCEKSYAVDTIAKQHGHTVLPLPSYHCVLNPIELVWSQLKHWVRKSNITPSLSSSVVEIIRKKTSRHVTSLLFWRGPALVSVVSANCLKKLSTKLFTAVSLYSRESYYKIRT